MRYFKNMKAEIITYNCSNCSISFSRKNNFEASNGNHFCGQKCRLIFQKTNSKHIVSNKYKVKNRVLARDKNRCVNCRRDDKRLVIHHKDKSGDWTSWGDSNNSMANLITLCNSCHVILHRHNNLT